MEYCPRDQCYRWKLNQNTLTGLHGGNGTLFCPERVMALTANPLPHRVEPTTVVDKRSMPIMSCPHDL